MDLKYYQFDTIKLIAESNDFETLKTRSTIHNTFYERLVWFSTTGGMYFEVVAKLVVVSEKVFCYTQPSRQGCYYVIEKDRFEQ